jgi:2-desacetyl-2-hydroxyethyl bacteriochlorophyllide A dehydrogenase
MVLERPGQLRVVNRDTPRPGSGDVLVRVDWAGVCGSDVDLFEGNRPEGFVRYPVVPGHEWVGTVEEVGAGVDPRLVGLPVVAEGIQPCDKCGPCLAGDATRCETGYDEIGFTRDGAWAEHVVVPAAHVHVLTGHRDLRGAAGIEPASCAAAAVRLADIQVNDRVAIIGGGTIGLLATQLALAARPSALVVVEPVVERWGRAQRCGATLVVDRATAEHEASFDVVIEAAGAVGSAQTSIQVARRGGRVVLTGIPSWADTMTTQSVVAKQLVVRGVFGAPSAAWHHAVSAYEDGSLDPGLLVTHVLGLTEAARALELVSQRDPTIGKVLLKP